MPSRLQHLLLQHWLPRESKVKRAFVLRALNIRVPECTTDRKPHKSCDARSEQSAAAFSIIIAGVSAANCGCQVCCTGQLATPTQPSSWSQDADSDSVFLSAATTASHIRASYLLSYKPQLCHVIIQVAQLSIGEQPKHFIRQAQVNSWVEMSASGHFTF